MAKKANNLNSLVVAKLKDKTINLNFETDLALLKEFAKLKDYEKDFAQAWVAGLDKASCFRACGITAAKEKKRIMENDTVILYIKHLIDSEAQSRAASANEVGEFLSNVLRGRMVDVNTGEMPSTRERLEAAKMLMSVNNNCEASQAKLTELKIKLLEKELGLIKEAERVNIINDIGMIGEDDEEY